MPDDEFEFYLQIMEKNKCLTYFDYDDIDLAPQQIHRMVDELSMNDHIM